jgi:hypothetical protein
VEPDIMGVLRGCARGKEPHEESRNKGGRAWFALSSSGRFLGYTQQRALLGLHEVVGCIAFLYFLESPPERMLHVLTEEPAKGLPPQPS